MSKLSYEKSFRASWSEGLLKYGFTQISNCFLENYHLFGISSCEALFIIHCFRFKWTVNKPYPSFETIAKAMGKDRSVIQRYASSLEKKGLIRREPQRGSTNRIDFSPLIERLEYISTNLPKGAMQKNQKPYVNLHTKEDSWRKHSNNKGINNGIEPVGEIIKQRFSNN